MDKNSNNIYSGILLISIFGFLAGGFVGFILELMFGGEVISFFAAGLIGIAVTMAHVFVEEEKRPSGYSLLMFLFCFGGFIASFLIIVFFSETLKSIGRYSYDIILVIGILLGLGVFLLRKDNMI